LINTPNPESARLVPNGAKDAQTSYPAATVDPTARYRGIAPAADA
jgi:hypothetical protein